LNITQAENVSTESRAKNPKRKVQSVPLSTDKAQATSPLRKSISLIVAAECAPPSFTNRQGVGRASRSQFPLPLSDKKHPLMKE
jgi:hypothetical protein